MLHHLIRRNLTWLFLIVLLAGTTVSAQTNLSIYSDQLDNGFQNWSWGDNDFASTSTSHTGSHSIAFGGGTWNAVSFWHASFDPAPYTNLDFWINGGTNGGQVVQIYLEFGTNSRAAYQLPALTKNSWQHYAIPFAALDAVGNGGLNRINFQLTSSGDTGSFYLDDVNLIAIPPATVHLAINANDALRPADSRWFGLNTAVWDSYFDTTNTANALAELGTHILRFPGGSLSDEYHWATGKSLNYKWSWGTSFASFLHIATNSGVQAIITVNYGTGTPSEAAAWVRAANITNHLGIKYWEIGNECYGSWETDSNQYPHDAYTYAVRAADYINQMKAADPSIKIGVPVVTGENSSSNAYSLSHPIINPRTGATNYGWTPIVLATMQSLGVLPDFLVHHVYPEFAVDNDQVLLHSSGNWAGDAADLRGQISDYIGKSGTNIELLCTENNADAGGQGRQSTSLVNGLYLADSLAQLMKTEFNAFIWWDLRNGTDYSGDFDSSLYGWRAYGDLGIINGPNTRHPVFYTFKLMQYFAQAGDTILSATSDYSLLSAYATRKANGALALLIINKDKYSSFDAQFALTNFAPWTNALVRSYGISEDEAARTNGPAAAQDIATNTLSFDGPKFNYAFPPYSVTLLTIPPTAPQLDVLPPTSSQCVVQVQGQPNTRYVIQSSTDLANWISVATNVLAGDVWDLTNAPSSPIKFWRAVWRE